MLKPSKLTTPTRDHEQAIGLLFDAKNKLFEAAGAIDQLGQPDYAAEFKEVADDIRRFLLHWSDA